MWHVILNRRVFFTVIFAVLLSESLSSKVCWQSASVLMHKLVHIHSNIMYNVVSSSVQTACLAFSALMPLIGHQEEHLACKNLSDEVPEWISIWSEVQIICIWSSWCHCHLMISCFIKIQIGSPILVPAYLGCPGKEAVKWVSVCPNCKYIWRLVSMRFMKSIDDNDVF